MLTVRTIRQRCRGVGDPTRTRPPKTGLESHARVCIANLHDQSSLSSIHHTSIKVLLGCVGTKVLLGCVGTKVLLGCVSIKVLLGCVGIKVLLGCVGTKVLLGCVGIKVFVVYSPHPKIFRIPFFIYPYYRHGYKNTPHFVLTSFENTILFANVRTIPRFWGCD